MRPPACAARWGPLLVMAAAALWGTTGTAQALAPPGAQPFVVGTVRLVGGSALLLALALARGTLRGVRQWPRGPLLWGALGIAVYQLAFFAGVSRAGVAVGTVVGIGSAPVWGGVLGYLVRGERPRPLWWAATALAVAGSALLILTGSGGGRADLGGIALAIGAGAAYAVYTTAGKRLLDEQPPDGVMAVVFAGGALLLAPLLAAADVGWLGTARGVAVALHLALVTVALAYLLFARGLQTVPVATTMTLTLAEPATAALLGMAVLGERLTPPALGGIALVFIGLGLLAWGRDSAESPPA